MAYPTWLLFLRDGTRFDEFLSNVYVPFDCILMVTQRDSKGTGEIVRDVYQISKEDNLRSMKFGEWNAREGFQGPQLGLYQRRNDLNGRNIRVVSVHVSYSDRSYTGCTVAHKRKFKTDTVWISVTFVLKAFYRIANSQLFCGIYKFCIYTIMYYTYRYILRYINLLLLLNRNPVREIMVSFHTRFINFLLPAIVLY